MNLSEICQQIKSLVETILTTNKELEEAKEESCLKVRNSVPLLIKAIKDVAPLVIKYYGSSIGNFGNKKLVWHEELGIGVEISNPTTQIEPLSIAEGDFPVENLAQIVQSRLESILKEIQNRKNQVVQRNKQLDQFLAMLEQWEKDNT